MAQKSQIAKLIEAFSSNSKKTIAAAMETAKRMPIADMKKVVEGVKKTNPRAATRLQKALDSGKGSALSRIVEAYNIKPKAKAGATKPTAKKSSLKQDDVLPEPPKAMATSSSQATDTTDLSVAPTRPEPVSKKRGRPQRDPDIAQEKGMQPAASDTVSSDAPAAPVKDDGVFVPYERKSAKTVQAAPEGQMATSTPEGEMFAAVDETMMSPSLAPNRSVSLAEQQPSALSDLLNSGELGTIPEAGLDARGRTPLTPAGDARTAGMLQTGETAYPQAGVLEVASGQNVPPRVDPNNIRSSDPGTGLSVIPPNRTPPPVEQQFKAESIFPGQEQGFTVPDTPEGMIRRLTGPVDNTPPSVDPSLGTDAIAADAITGPGVAVREGNNLIVPDAAAQSAYPRTSAEELAKTANTNAGPFRFGKTPEVEQAGELISTRTMSGDNTPGPQGKAAPEPSSKPSGTAGGDKNELIPFENAKQANKTKKSGSDSKSKFPLMKTILGGGTAAAGTAIGTRMVDSYYDAVESNQRTDSARSEYQQSMAEIESILGNKPKLSRDEINQKLGMEPVDQDDLLPPVPKQTPRLKDTI
jgi:hypothetical protein